jgi:hypothetical protein
MTQTLYAHMNKRNKNNKKRLALDPTLKITEEKKTGVIAQVVEYRRS